MKSAERSGFIPGAMLDARPELRREPAVPGADLDPLCSGCCGVGAAASLGGLPARCGGSRCRLHALGGAAALGLLLLLAACLGLLALLGPRRGEPVEVALFLVFEDTRGRDVNETIVVRRDEEVVTFHTLGSAEQSHCALYDHHNGLVWVRPASRRVCLLRRMSRPEKRHVASVLRGAGRGGQVRISRNATRFPREILLIRASRPTPLPGHAAVPALCHSTPVLWAARSAEMATWRTMYFCLDLCFLNSLCASFCFYYLPD